VPEFKTGYSDFGAVRKIVAAVGQWLAPGNGRFHLGKKIKPAKFRGQLPPYPSQMDFARGPAAQAAAIESQTEPLLSARFVLHITEVALAMQGADHGSICEFTTRF